jgi:hypothetical protein
LDWRRSRRQNSLRNIAAGPGKRTDQACGAWVDLAFGAEMSFVEPSASQSGDEFAALQVGNSEKIRRCTLAF